MERLLPGFERYSTRVCMEQKDHLLCYLTQEMHSPNVIRVRRRVLTVSGNPMEEKISFLLC